MDKIKEGTTDTISIEYQKDERRLKNWVRERTRLVEYGGQLDIEKMICVKGNHLVVLGTRMTKTKDDVFVFGSKKK